MTLVAFDLARGMRSSTPTTPYDAAWSQFATGIGFTAPGSALRTATSPAGSGFSFDSAAGDAVLRRATFAESGGTLGSDSAAATPLVTFDWTGGQALAVTLNAAWNTIKNFQLTSFGGTTLTLANWVDVDVQLADTLSRAITIEGAKRGNVALGNGNDTLTVGIDSNMAGSDNRFSIATGGGDDVVVLRGSATNHVGGAYSGNWTTTSISTGAGHDTITGWGSADTVDGGTGTDTFVLRGLKSGYSITTANGVTTVRDINLADGNDGTDILRNVEQLRFADGSVQSLVANRAPVVTASSATVTEDQAGVKLPALANATDPDGNPLSLTSASAQFGTVSIEGGSLRYTPSASAQALNAGQSQVDTISYGVSDGTATTTGTISVTVTGITDVAGGPTPTITVGAGKQFSTLAAAVAASRDGDVIGIDAGTYVNDFATINTKITLVGVGGLAHFTATGLIGNGKGILVTNTDITIDGLEFSGATVADQNGAGIRYQGGALTIRNSYFHDNQNGILGNPVAGGSISIDNSEFWNNGRGDGYTHNLYVGDIAKLTVTDSFFHSANVGHEIKSRARENTIVNNRIYDQADGTGSYSIDLPNGGVGVIRGNIIEQGALGQNPSIIHFGGEGTAYAGSSLVIDDNVVVNHMASGSSRLLLNQATGVTASVTNNDVYGLGSGQIVSGGATVSGTTYLAADPVLDTSAPWSLIG
jgi:VCBS repeat-containing protein